MMKVMTVQGETFTCEKVEYVTLVERDNGHEVLAAQFRARNGYNAGRVHTVPLMHVAAVIEADERR